MKNKSHISKWAMALCAVAVFSFAAARNAQAGRISPGGNPGPTIMPAPTEIKQPPKFQIEPLPPIPAPVETTLPVGTFTGTVVD
jgi:hypothetical protein